MPDRCTVRVPASSANLGPGFDSFAAALDLWLEVTVERADCFSLDTELAVARDETNILVQAFSRYLSPEGFRFHVTSQIPLAGGLGSSAAARVAGLIAGRYFAAQTETFDQAALYMDRSELLREATDLEGHPDNAAAALYGGFTVCHDAGITRIAVPRDLAALLVVPHQPVSTSVARSVLPQNVPLKDAVFNLTHAACLLLALEREDLDLLATALTDRLHQPYRANLYPASSALIGQAQTLGALGVTISGAGPTTLVWVHKQNLEDVKKAVQEKLDSTCQLLATAFTAQTATVI